MDNIKYVVIILLVAFCSCDKRKVDGNECIYEKVISDYEQENFEKEGFPVVNYIFDETIVDKHYFESVVSTSSDYFTQSDIDTLKKQVANLRFDRIKHITTKKLLPAKKIEEWYKYRYEGFWKRFWEKYGDSGYYRLSAPLFTKNKQQFIIQLEITLSGLSSSGMCRHYKMVNNRWVLQDGMIGIFY